MKTHVDIHIQSPEQELYEPGSVFMCGGYPYMLIREENSEAGKLVNLASGRVEYLKEVWSSGGDQRYAMHRRAMEKMFQGKTFSYIEQFGVSAKLK